MCSDEDKCTKCGEDRNVNGFIKGKKICGECNKKACRDYKQRNKDKISDYNKTYKKIYKTEISDYNREYSLTHREEIQKRHTPYLRELKKTSPQHKIGVTLRSRMYQVLKGRKKEHSKELLGCSYEFLLSWFGFLFEDDMTLKNHGKVWHVDHIIPVNSFDLIDEDERFRCCNWSNLQPLYAKDNLSKKEKVDGEEIVRITKLAKLDDKPKWLEYDRSEYY